MRYFLLLLTLVAGSICAQQPYNGIYFSSGNLTQKFHFNLEERFDDRYEHREVLRNQFHSMGFERIQSSSIIIAGFGLSVSRTELHWLAEDGEGRGGRYGGSYKGTEREFNVHAYGLQVNGVFGLDLLSRSEKISLKLLCKLGYGYIIYTNEKHVSGIEIDRSSWQIWPQSGGHHYRTPYDPDWSTKSWLYANHRAGLEIGIKDQ
ncbi:MAG: hypothetical protein AAF193_11690, partial [Bacteroidota bacterium]